MSVGFRNWIFWGVLFEYLDVSRILGKQHKHKSKPNSHRLCYQNALHFLITPFFTSQPYTFIIMSYQAIVGSLINFLSATSGRDKACRLIQYLMRFLSTGIRNRSEGSALKHDHLRRAIKMQSLGSSMAATRKVLRFGRPIGIAKNIIKTLHEISSGKVLNTPKALFKILGDLCLMLFFLFDHYLYFERIGLANNSARRVSADYLSNLFWLLECIFGILRNAMDYVEVKQTCPKSEIKRRTNEIVIDTVRNVLDIPVAVGFLNPEKVSSRTIGLLGTITSLIGIYQLW